PSLSFCVLQSPSLPCPPIRSAVPATESPVGLSDGAILHAPQRPSMPTRDPATLPLLPALAGRLAALPRLRLP
ncbi:unnamed protein product, partial [Urochloa humidicola]